MSTTTVACACGQRLTERIDYVARAYLIMFTDPETGAMVTACPTCNKLLYAALRDGDLKPAA